MSDGRVRLRCACGWETTGTTEEVVVATQEHGRRVHNMDSSREEVLARVLPATDQEAPES